ncbi:hypothetical protein D9757_009473 [Collybiopsis confluens]|uniref:Uncharacterized protein n=1 Tax=Collybiopsis confluens TaxID=2823264 RepID=A0A8H5M0W7_9AGAR|nr:hypothetical protein D9757_009473 [Collybiopsis confluens]
MVPADSIKDLYQSFPPYLTSAANYPDRLKELYYGFGLNLADCFAYFEDHQAKMRPVPPDLVGSSLVISIKMVVEDYLTEICEFGIRMEAVFNMEHDFVMRIYDSHRFQDYQLEGKDEEEVIELLKQAFPKFREQKSPRWFYPGNHVYPKSPRTQYF